MPDRAARIIKTIDATSLVNRLDAAAAIGFLKTRDRQAILAKTRGWLLWSFEFNGNEENAYRRLTPRRNSGVGVKQGQIRRFRRRI